MNHKRTKALAAIIARYWQARGYPVHVWVEKEPYNHKAQSTGFTVRSNLVNGLPVNHRPGLVADLAAHPYPDK